MKITQIKGYEVVVPAHEAIATSSEFGPLLFDRRPKIIFEAHTDVGHVGLGETTRGVDEAALRGMLAHLRGVDLTTFRLQEPPLYDLGQNDTFAHHPPGRPHRISQQYFGAYREVGVHAMLFDLVGKQRGVRATDLMGGAFRDRVRVDYWMGRMTPQESARACKRAQDLGYRGVKCKCALEDDNVERAEAVKQACGERFEMTFDPNGRFYRYGEAIGMLKRLSAVGNVGCVEDPFQHVHIDEYKLLRSHGLFPVALHTAYSNELLHAIKIGACDYANLSDLPWRVLQASGLCWLANIATWYGSGVDLGVIEALLLHVCASAKSMTRPSDIFGRAIRQHNLIDNPFDVEDGEMAVPTNPGLGVSLDYDAIERFATRSFSFQMD